MESGGSRLRLLVPLVLIALAVPAVLAATPSATYTVTATNFAWTPQTLSILPGESVTFTNSAGSHNWVSDDSMGSCNLPCTKTFPNAGTFRYHCGPHPWMTGTIIVGDIPRVAFTSHSDADSILGEVTLRGTATHVGEDIVAVDVQIGTGAFAAATLVDDLGDTETWEFTFSTTSFVNGPIAIVARATNSLAQTGQSAITLHVANPSFVDFDVASVSTITPTANTWITVNAVVRNLGNAASPPFLLKAEYAYKDNWHPIGTLNAPSIPAGSSVSRAFLWDNGAFLYGRFDVRVTADPSNVVAESDETNNARTASTSFFTPLVEGIDLRDP